MYSAYKLNKQGDNIQPWRTPFPIGNQSVVPCPVLAVASWPAYRFLRGRSGGLVFPSLTEFFTVYCDPRSQGFGIVSKEEIDVFLELSCFFDDPAGVGNLISGSSAFSETSLNNWKFTVHVLLKPGLNNFEHYFTSLWDECNCAVVWAFFGIGMKTDLCQSCGHCWVFQIRWHIECSTFTASSFTIWNSSAGILSPPLTFDLPIRTRLSFPLSQFLPSGSFHKPLILIHQRADRIKTTITEN